VRSISAALALVLAFAALSASLACAPSDRGDSSARDDAAARRASAGPDPVVLRVPRAGGPAVAYVYPRLDSVVWRSTANVPALERVLAFDMARRPSRLRRLRRRSTTTACRSGRCRRRAR